MSHKNQTTVKVPPLERMCWAVPQPDGDHPFSAEGDVCCAHEHRPGKLTCRFHAKHEDAAQDHREKHRHVKAYHATT